MSTNHASKSQSLANLQALIAGTLKHTPSAQLTLGNASFTTASLTSLFQSLVDAMTAENAADTAAKDAHLATQAVEAKAGPVIKAYRKYLRAQYGSATQVLADYGLTPEKARKPLTVKALSAKVERNASTRKARGTVGPKVRSEIKGTVTDETPAAAVVQPPAVPAKPTP